MISPVKNQVYTAEILGYSSEGLGIARIHGQVVFVHDAIRGEVCDILIMKVGRSASFGKAVAWHYNRCDNIVWWRHHTCRS